MRVKDEYGLIQQFPNELAVLIIADPSQGEPIPDMTCYEVGMLIHSIIGVNYQVELSYEENVQQLWDLYEARGKVSEKGRQVAIEAIARYEREVTEETMGLIDPRDLM